MRNFSKQAITKATVTFAFLLFTGSTAFSQTSETKVDHNTQYWLGYMTSTTLSQKYSLWNDFHLVPEGFAVVRTGLTRHVNNASITGGYAFLWLPTGSGNTSLHRTEHRPWAQIQFNLPVSSRYSLIQRTRYDARFRENVSQGEVTDGFAFNHRIRFLISVKRTLTDKKKSYIPYLSVSNEVLLNVGREITYNTFDQNRVSVALGIQSQKTQYQVGLMNRFVQTGPAKYTLNHTLVVWITQKFDWRKVPAEKQSGKL